MMDNKVIRCENCLFYDRYMGDNGYCRRYPPKCSRSEGHILPDVTSDEFCGEFKPRNKPNEKMLAEGGALRN
jgi:hypothetical protein